MFPAGGTVDATACDHRGDMRKLLCAAAATALVVTCTPDVERYRPLRAGEPAPAFAAPVLDGDTLRLAELRGQAVLLNIWATWCPPCRDEMPELQVLHDRYARRGLRVLGVSVDARGAEAAVREFVRDHGITFTILHDPAESVARQFRTTGVPETFLIGPDGRLAHRWIGRFDLESPAVAARVEAVLPR
jgi:cytochrome c biogenesis protein CcmG, thiol:disulfide interchange protein DsbE